MFGLLFFFLLVIGGLVFFVIRSYNALQTMGQMVKEYHSNIMVVMKKRSDLINQLISVVSGYAEHEKLTQITVSGNNATFKEAAGAYQQGTSTLGRIQTFAAGFPDLKANTQYQALMGEISNVEASLHDRREKYNAVVRRYNSMRVQFPHVLWATKLGFPEAPYFDVENADDLKNLQNFKTDDGAMLREVMSATTAKLSQGVSAGTAKLSAGAATLLDKAKKEVAGEATAESSMPEVPEPNIVEQQEDLSAPERPH